MTYARARQLSARGIPRTTIAALLRMRYADIEAALAGKIEPVAIEVVQKVAIEPTRCNRNDERRLPWTFADFEIVRKAIDSPKWDSNFYPLSVKLGRTPMAVKQCVRRLGLSNAAKVSSVKKRNSKSHRFSDEEAARIVELLCEGMRFANVAEDINRSRITLYKRLKILRLDPLYAAKLAAITLRETQYKELADAQ